MNSSTQRPSGVISQSWELLSCACELRFVIWQIMQNLVQGYTWSICEFKFKDWNSLQLKKMKLILYKKNVTGVWKTRITVETCSQEEIFKIMICILLHFTDRLLVLVGRNQCTLQTYLYIHIFFPLIELLLYLCISFQGFDELALHVYAADPIWKRNFDNSVQH